MDIKQILRTWTTLNEHLMRGDEELAIKLLKAEQKGEKRPTFLRRIHSRINKLRAERERKSLG